MADDRIALSLTGRRTDAQLPALFAPAARSAGQPDDPFLPAGYLKATGAFDVSAAARGSADGAAAQHLEATADEVVVLELTDGSVLVTSAARLRDSLERASPELLGADGAILLEQLRADGGASRGFGDVAGGLIAKVFTFAVGAVEDAIVGEAAQAAGGTATLGVSWLGTKALMAAIESRLDQPPGLYRWVGSSGRAQDLESPDGHAWWQRSDADPARFPMLVFVHGTASNTLGSFGDLATGDRDLWGHIEREFAGGVWAFEHRTLSQSPIENAIALLQSLPTGAHVSLVSHSRGGLVADLLCLDDFDALIEDYAYALPGTGDADPAEAARVLRELAAAHAGQREQLHLLAALKREKRLVLQRYVRTASPANGTKLASGNFDVFLSALLTLIGQVPFFFGSPFYAAFKRVVIEIAKNRTSPHLVPGIEAMLPDSPMARLLRDAPVQGGVQMAVIAGDIQGGHLLKRMAVLLTDFLLFDNDDNDLVVNTSAMLAGVAPKLHARVLFDRGADVSHFRYFTNLDTRSALRAWLVAEMPAALEQFRALPTPAEYEGALAAAAARDATAAALPVVVVLPGVMGSHLQVRRKDRVWFDPLDIANGGLAKIAWEQPGVEAEDLFGMLYGKLCEELSRSHRVERFAYDWRQPVDVLAERFGQFLDQLMKATDQPIRLLAHSMGGLVVRATIYKRRSVMDALMARDGARLVMMGTPHQGAHSMVENLIGKGDTLRTLVRLDLRHDMQQVLDIVAGFRGALQLLPKPGFTDMFQGQSDGGEKHDYQSAQTWHDFKGKLTDFWFGNGRAGTPPQDVLDDASWLWHQDGQTTPALPAAYESKSVYVFGAALNTPCGVRVDAAGRLKMVGTTHGDGTVTWASGRIGGIGTYYYMDAAHGDLLSTREHFGAIVELLTAGATARLPTTPPVSRAVDQPVPVTYDAGPPCADDPDTLQRALLGGSRRNRVAPRPRRQLEISVKAMDLRSVVDKPILVGQYELDPIAGPQALIDRELLAGDLSERHQLGLYAGPRGTATVVLRDPGVLARECGGLTGAVVAGLGPYQGDISLADLTESVRTGALRYLLQVVDVLGRRDREVGLASLLVGFNSSANLTVGASVEALVRGVMEANLKFFETTRLDIRITRLDIVEIYLDTAISAVYALRHLTPRLQAQAALQGTAIVCRGELQHDEGSRPRLYVGGGGNYWPRLSITDADAREDGSVDQPRTAVADRLRFLYVGQRARAESVVQQRQPGLIEQIVKRQIGVRVWQEDFGRMLFQLMVPHDFKDAARQLERVVLVVDSTTANLPWELMLADDPRRSDGDKRPLALRTAVVRQLATTRFRRQVLQSVERTALVVGNPSLEGFEKAFVDAGGQPLPNPPALPHAEREAAGVATLLGSMGYHVQPVIGDDHPAQDVLSHLYHQPWRLLHVSAHGVFDLRHVDGRRRSGVLLSDGLLITAAEVAAMEIVPELVFLNCCHLGQVDFGSDGNKLAASLARELIDIGVRCVVVAGWAVSDDGAALFGQTFYQQLLLHRRSFGDAVFEARMAVWRQQPSDITWGAFQAYGDPGWLAEPRAERAGSGGVEEPYVALDEALDDLGRIRADLARRPELQGPRAIRVRAERVKAVIARCPSGWRTQPALNSALGTTWYELGDFDAARDALLLALRALDPAGRVPVRDIERLANAEARLGERRANAAPGDAAAQRDGEALIAMAVERLNRLDELLAAGASAEDGRPNAERCALRGSAFKRQAGLYAGRLLRGDLDAAGRATAREALAQALARSVAAYRRAEGEPGRDGFSPYLALNRLALDALIPWPVPADRDAAIALARQCRQSAAQEFARRPGAWPALMQAEAMLVERLIEGGLGQAGDAGSEAFDAVARAYAQARASIVVKPSQFDSVLSQMELLSRFIDALAVVADGAPVSTLTATRLLELVQRLNPGRPPRADRPAAAPVAHPAPDREPVRRTRAVPRRAAPKPRAKRAVR
jgi:triacylglycerol esterase/lipase EstA (alpha/beta hydrolase family)